MADSDRQMRSRGQETLPRSWKLVSGAQNPGAIESDLDFSHDPGGIVNNLKHLLPLVSVADSDNYSTTKRVRHLNDLAKVIKHAGHTIEPHYPLEKVIENVRLALVSAVKEVRAGALRVLRYLLTSRDVLIRMLRFKVDILVARSLDCTSAREIERLQAMRLVRQAVLLAPDLVTRAMVSPMVSIVLQDSEPLDNLTWACMATLCEIALLNPQLAAQTGTIKALLRGLLKCPTFRISESVVLALTHLINLPNTRKYVRSQLDMETLLAPLTDLDYRHLVEEMDKSTAKSDHKNRVDAAKMAVTSMLKSWPGVFCLCSPAHSGFPSLLPMLPLAKPFMQREILVVLYSAFQLQQPEWTNSFTDAITSIDPAQLKSEWELTEGWIATEGKDLLPPKTVGRTNLLSCYQALLLAALMDLGLFQFLIETVRSGDRHVTVMATILMAQLLHLANTILPAEYSSDSHYLPTLIASAMAFDTQEERNRASEVISCLDRVHQLKKQPVRVSTLYLKLILEQTGYSDGHRMAQDQELFQYIPADLDEAALSSLVKDTSVLSTKEFHMWKWSLILSVLQHPYLKPLNQLEDTTFARFVKRLCNFFMPRNKLYSVINYSHANSQKYSLVGLRLIKYLCRADEVGSNFLSELVADIVTELSQVTASKLTADVFSSHSVSHKLARDYFLLLGTISFHKASLLQLCKAYGPLLDICNYQNRADLMKLMIASLDFAHDTYSRVILSKLLTSCDTAMRLYATRHMRVLLRAKMPFFNSWGLELLIPQLYDVERPVALEAVDIFDEACEEESFLEALVLQQPQLAHLGEKGLSLLTRFIAVKRGFTLMSRLGHLEKMMDIWFNETNTLYVYVVEERLAETLTSFKQTEEGEFIRRTNTSPVQPKAFVPVHFYGQLVQHDQGCTLLREQGHVECFVEAIRSPVPSSVQRLLEVKAAVWALGHIGSSPGGLGLLQEKKVLPDLVEMAEASPVLSLRGTCFYALCLISKTMAGASLLMEEGWTSVRHSQEERWPLVLEELDLPPPPSTSKLHSPPLASTPLKPGKDPPRLLHTHSVDPWPQPRPRPHVPVAKSSSNSNELTLSTPAGGMTSVASMPHLMNAGSRGHVRRTARAASRKGVGVRFEERSPTVPSKPLPSLPLKPVRPISVTSLQDFTSPDGLISSLRLFRRSGSSSSQLRTSISGSSAPFTGVTLPLDVLTIFEYDEEAYEGSSTKIISAPDFDDVVPHDQSQCLECMLLLSRQPRDIEFSMESLHPIRSSVSASSLSRSHSSETSPALSSRMGSVPEQNGTKPRENGTKPVALSPLPSHRDQSGRGRDRERGGASSSRSPSPLVRMKRVAEDEPPPAGESPSKTGESPSKTGESPSKSGESPTDSSERDVGGSSGKEAGAESSSSSGNKAIHINVISSSVATTKSSESSLYRPCGEEEEDEGRAKMHSAVLEVVYGLSSSVSLRKNTAGLNLVFQKFPELSEDVCLYSKVMALLSTYPYCLAIRRFIQAKFERLPFTVLFTSRSPLEEEVAEEELLSSASSSRRGSLSSSDLDFFQRRRSSTSDVTLFRKRMSLSESHKEEPFANEEEEGEAPCANEGEEEEEEVESASVNEDEEGSRNENSNNNGAQCAEKSPDCHMTSTGEAEKSPDCHMTSTGEAATSSPPPQEAHTINESLPKENGTAVVSVVMVLGNGGLSLQSGEGEGSVLSVVDVGYDL